MNPRRFSLKDVAHSTALVACAAVVSTSTAGAPKCTPTWSTQPGVPGIADGSINAMHLFDDGSGLKLYAVGGFQAASGVAGTQNIAVWNGTAWESVGGGFTGGQYTNALEVFNGELYAGGYFNSAGGVAGTEKIAKWNGTTWASIGAQMSSFLNSIWGLQTWDDGTGEALYIAGNFIDAGGNAGFDHIVKYDGSSFSQLGGTITGAGIPLIVFCMTPWDDGGGEELYIGGRFSEVNGVPAARIAKWDGTTWTPVGTGLGSALSTSPYDMVEFEGSLYIGGQSISSAGGVAVQNVARWDGTSWHAVGAGLNGTVWDLAVYDDGSGPALYAAGLFTASGSTPINFVAKLVDGQWVDAGSGINDNCYAALVVEDGAAQDLYVGGKYTMAAGSACNRLVRLNGCDIEVACIADVVDSGTFQPPPDGQVDGADLAYLLGEWGSNPGSSADIVDSGTFQPPPDGIVDGADLAYLLGAWGACE